MYFVVDPLTRVKFNADKVQQLIKFNSTDLEKNLYTNLKTYFNMKGWFWKLMVFYFHLDNKFHDLGQNRAGSNRISHLAITEIETTFVSSIPRLEASPWTGKR